MSLGCWLPMHTLAQPSPDLLPLAAGLRAVIVQKNGQAAVAVHPRMSRAPFHLHHVCAAGLREPGAADAAVWAHRPGGGGPG